MAQCLNPTKPYRETVFDVSQFLLIAGEFGRVAMLLFVEVLP